MVRKLNTFVMKLFLSVKFSFWKGLVFGRVIGTYDFPFM